MSCRSRWLATAAAALAGVLLAAGCQWPRDAAGTLDEVRGGVLRVGVTESAPWTVVTRRPGGETVVDGAEARLVERLAGRLDARVEWHTGAESELMAALGERILDLVVGGLDATAPWTRLASLTRPYVRMRTVVAVPPGMPSPRELAGVRVAVRAGSAEVAALRDEGADVVPLAELTRAELDRAAGAGGALAAAVGEWRVAGLGLRATPHELASHDHVWAVPLGENGWQVEVERFLLATSHDEVAGLLAEAEREAGGA